MEQENGAHGLVATQSARNVLPGEPFDPPMHSQVPGPRPAPVQQPPQQFQQPPQQFQPDLMAPPAAETLPPPLWNYGPAGETFAAPTGAPVVPAGASVDFESLHDFASLPAAQPYEPQAFEQQPHALRAPAPESYVPQSYAPQSYAPQSYAPQSYAPQAPAGYGAPAAPQGWPAPQSTQAPEGFGPPQHADLSTTLPPLPPAPAGEEAAAEGGRRRKARGKKASGAKASGGKAPDKRLLALALVVVLAGGGYFGYTQLTKKSDSTTATATVPTVPKVAPTVTATPYGFPTHVAGFALHTGSAASLQNRQLRAFAIKAYPTFGKTVSVASYSAGSPAVVAMSFHPAAGSLSTTYSTVLANVRKPATGNVVGAFTAVPPGAAGGKMTCGGQRGASPISYCVWQGKSSVGLMYVTGSPKSQITEILTREIRAYAEH